MELEQAWYIVRYYETFLNANERTAWRHLFATAKITRGQTDKVAQEAVSSTSKPIRELLSTDPAVKELAAAGIDAFVLRTAERVYRDHRDEIFFNTCPLCGGLTKTPKAQQCHHCHHDWHSTSR